MRNQMKELVESNRFTLLIIVAIIVNAILIGVQTSIEHLIVNLIQDVILIIFVVEIVIRFIGRESTLAYFKNRWNLFDIFIVGVSFIPEHMFEEAEMVSALRLLRVIRVIRLFKVMPELQVMTRVLFRSVLSLSYAGLLFMIFMYLYAIVGVILFSGQITVHTALNTFTDPYGSVGEALFSLFRILTGEDWTDLRYNLLAPDSSNILVNVYHVSWMILSAFLLGNIVVGAVISNYEVALKEEEKSVHEDEQAEIVDRLKSLEEKIDTLVKRE